MKQSRRWITLALCLVGSFDATVVAAADFPVSHGRQVIINRGLQLQSMVLQNDGVHTYPNFSNVSLWESAGFSTFNLWNEPDTQGTVLPLLPSAQQWGKVWGNPPTTSWSTPGALPLGVPAINLANHWGLYPSEVPYAANLVDLQWSDERSDTMSHLSSLAALFQTWNQYYPQALAHANFCDGPGCSNPLTDADLSAYVQGAQPDVLTFDQYPAFAGSSLDEWYNSMQKYRAAALAGFTTSSGANSGPLPYGQFMNMWRSSYSAGSVNESFINLQHCASLAFGYTWLSTYLYNRYTVSYPVLFVSDGTSAGDQYPDTAVFSLEHDANRQTQNLGNYFTRAVSTGVFYKPAAPDNTIPTRMSAWASKSGTIAGVAQDYVTAITPYTNSTANGGVAASTYPHSIVGYFMPLQSMRDIAHVFVNGLHFMIVNGNIGSGTASSRGQWYHIEFDFTGSSNNSLLRLNRTTGQVEMLALTPMGNNQYYLDLYLPGGIGDVFSFWDSKQPYKPSIAPIITELLQ